jgi:NTP pyrophosphatase (non-canonical NTP hydrolase)
MPNGFSDDVNRQPFVIDTKPRTLQDLRGERPTAHTTLRAANEARQREWDAGNQITIEYRGNELGGECGEAQNIIKKLARERMGIRGSRATIAQLREELADVVICVDLIAMATGIDLDAAVREKFNKTSEANGLRTRLAAS